MGRGEACEKSQEKTFTGSVGNSRVHNLKCYHGVQKKEEVANLMRGERPGTFLFRSCFVKSGVALALFLSVKVRAGDSDANIHHYQVEDRAGEYYLMQELMEKEELVTRESKAFPTLEELIGHFQHHRLACKIRLGRPLKRPSWQLRHNSVVYDDTGKLGSGNFCIVYRGMLRKQGKIIPVAIKVSKNSDKESAALMETRNLLLAEARIMMNYNNINVIRIYGVACDVPPFMVCMEFCSGGSLEDALKKYGKDMEEFERQILLIDAARGMRYLHDKKCVHRDLASRNCLISFDGIVKIADFGLSKTLEKDQKAFKEALKEAPLAWLAPECIQRESEFSTKTDVWAFGVVIFEVYNNAEKLFAGEEDIAILRKIKKANMPTIENRTKVPAMQAVLSSIWTRKPDDRPEMQKVLEKLVAALVPIQPDDLKRLQINSLKGVSRTQMPNTDLEMDVSVVNEEVDQDGSEKNRKVKGGSKKKTGNRHNRSGKRTPKQEESPKSKKPVPLRNTVRKGPGATSE